MCILIVANTIIEVLDEKVKNGEIFTSFDITKEARIKTDENVGHKDVRDIVNNEFTTSQMAGYDRELCTLDLSGSPQALVYFPDSKQADAHPLVKSSTDSNVTDDMDDDVVLADDEYKLTSEGRVNIPKKMLSQITANAGTYDIMINGSLKCISPEKDGRLRVSLRRIGISDSKVRITADILNNTFKIRTV